METSSVFNAVFGYLYCIVYKSPQFESMVFGLVVDRLITIGYPEAIRDFEYDPTFVVRLIFEYFMYTACIYCCISFDGFRM